MRLFPRTLRGRLTIVFALVTAALCLLVGILVDVQYRNALRDALDAGLRSRYEELRQKLGPAGENAPVQPALPDAESFAQVLRSDGFVAAAAPKALLKKPVLELTELERAQVGRITVERNAPPRGERSRFLAGPAGRELIVIVGSDLDEATAAQHRLELALAVGLPLLAALVSLGGWFLAGAALTPVRDLIEEADSISAVTARGSRGRLTIPRGGAELGQLASRLNELLGRIEAALEHERAFLDDASHELRTPISITRSELELARMQAPEGSDVAAALDSALEEVGRLDRLAVNLLVLARARSAGPPAQDPVDLGAVARRAAESVRRSRRESAVPIDVEGAATVPGDESALERALVNVVDNAARHAQGHVEVFVRPDSDHVVVDVVDDGPGFPPELLNDAAGRFVRGPAVLDHGAGLGLAITDAIAAAHGGSTEISNRPEGGASVRLRLPTEA